MPDNSARHTLYAYAALALGVLTISFSGILVSWAQAPGAVTGFYRMATPVLVLAWPALGRMKRLGGLPRREIQIALFGGVLFASDLVFWNTGVLISGATTPTLMGNTAPLWVGLGAMIFFRERLNHLFWIGLLLAMAGAAVILGIDAVRDVGLGTLFGLLAGVFYGAYFLVTQRGRQTLDPHTYLWLAALGATVILFLMSLALRQPLTGYSSTTYLNLFLLGLFPQVVGHLCFVYALGYLPASIVSPTALAQPVLTAVLAGPLLQEYLSLNQILAGLLVLAGIYIVHYSRLRPGAKHAAVPPVEPLPPENV